VLYYESGANFAAGNTFSITDGTNTETWTFVAGAPAGNQVQVQGTVGESMQSLCARINATGTLWTAAEPTDLGLGLTNACVILRRAQGEVAYKDRIYATTAPQLGVLNYSKGVQYCSYAVPGDLDWPEFVTPLPTTDPEVQYFGWGSNNAPGGLVLGVLDNQQGWLYKANRQVGGASSWVSSDLYTPGAPVDWTPPAPTSISEALDRLAVVAPSSP
jgi:hypothetical protein